MPSSTTNYSLSKPLVNNATDQDLWGGYLNTNMDTIDTKLKLGIDRVKRAITSSDSLVAGDRKKMITADATSAEITFSLLAAATAGDGFEFTIVKTDSSGNAVVIDGDGSEEISGSTTYSLTGEGDAVTLVCDGAEWWVSGSKTTPAAVASASSTSEGITEYATTAETQTGTDSARSVTPAGMKGALGLSKYYESSEQSFSFDSLVNLTHSLGSIPKFMVVELVCKVTEGGYSVGDRIHMTDQLGAGSGDTGAASGYSSTKVFFVIGDSIKIFNKSTFNSETLTPSSWRVVIRAWA